MTLERLLAFGEAWSSGDVDHIMSFFALECSYHASVGPKPGRTYEGREAVRRGVLEMLEHDRDGTAQSGHTFVAGRHGAAEWSYEFTAADGTTTRVRGCDVFEFEGGLIRRKDAFRKTVGVAERYCLRAVESCE